MAEPKYKAHISMQMLGPGIHNISSQKAFSVTFETDKHSIDIGCTIDGVRPFIGTTEFRCPTIDGVIDQNFKIVVPQGRAYLIVTYMHISHV